MDSISCTEPYFQWDKETHSCLGCVEDERLHDTCKRCDDYKGNIDKEFEI